MINYTNVDRIFSRLNRDLKGTEFNESDIIEWIGEALEFLEVPQILQEDVKFLQVKDYHVDMPSNLHMITQIAKNIERPVPVETHDISCNNPGEHNTNCSCCKKEELKTSFEKICIEESEYDNMPDQYIEAFLNADEIQYLKGEEFNKLDLDWTYQVWTSCNYYKNNFAPVRLASGTFFNSIVCKEKNTRELYDTCAYEYTIIGHTEKRLRFNFIEGEIAISYLKNCVDKDTGYPLIPDEISYITAIVYYIKWKIAESMDWAGREGWAGKASSAEDKWLKYARQAKNKMKMPKTLDEYQNLLEQTHYLIPNHKQYYGYFGNLNKNQARDFQILDRTRTRTQY